jgi:hypothetical protein
MNAYRMLRAAELPVAAWTLFFMTMPLYKFSLFGLCYFIFLKGMLWEATFRTAVRLDYLPNLEMVSVTKVGPFGILYNTLWKTTDFERIDTIPEITKRKVRRALLLEQ